MFVMTAKLSKSKLIAAGGILLAVLLLLLLLLKGGTTGTTAPAGATNEDRLAYLASFGWSTDPMPKENQTVRIPDSKDNKVFARYNDLQLSQGFDLTEYAGKEVMRYVYEILNYPEAGAPVYASVLVYEGRIIGGDVTNTAPDGVIHGFRKPGTESAEDSREESQPTTASATEPPTEAPTESNPPQ